MVILTVLCIKNIEICLLNDSLFLFSKLLIIAEVQTPLIDFHPLHIDFNQCFWNVPVTETVTITNLNMLDCDLEWIEVSSLHWK